ncbi:MAG: hypothetical protein GF364_22005, partial [Candidatus Lokiarchaeota archaeon]|nr:hypothetical protein [Candidatus Lokiarchaeota archaeon]
MFSYRSAMSSKNIEFEILKRLKLNPTHGYDIYKYLARNGFIAHNKASYVYKIIRRLEHKNLIETKELTSKGNRKKNMLSLTKEGRGFYYEKILQSAQDFLSVIIEAN